METALRKRVIYMCFVLSGHLIYYRCWKQDPVLVYPSFEEVYSNFISLKTCKFSSVTAVTLKKCNENKQKKKTAFQSHLWQKFSNEVRDVCDAKFSYETDFLSEGFCVCVLCCVFLNQFCKTEVCQAPKAILFILNSALWFFPLQSLYFKIYCSNPSSFSK